MSVRLALALLLVPTVVSADELDGPAAAETLIAALERDDYTAALPVLHGPVVKFGKKVAAKTLKKACKKKGLAAALGIASEDAWTVTAKDGELLVHPGAADGLTTVLVLAADDDGWSLTEVRREFFQFEPDEEPSTYEPPAAPPPKASPRPRKTSYPRGATIIGYEDSGASRTLTLDKGERDGVVVGCTAVLQGKHALSFSITYIAATESSGILFTTMSTADATTVEIFCP